MRPLMIVHNLDMTFDMNFDSMRQLNNGATRQMDILLQGDWYA